MNRIRIGARTNVQDGTVIHVDPPRPGGPDAGYPALIGEDVLIGHMAMVHGCTLHDRAFVGLGAIVMDGCEIESDAMLAAGAMLTQGKQHPVGPALGGPPGQISSATSATQDLEMMRSASPIMSRSPSATPRRSGTAEPRAQAGRAAAAGAAAIASTAAIAAWIAA